MKPRKIIIAFITVTLLLSAGVITLGVLLGKSYDKNGEANAQLEAHYQQAYYTLLDEANDMEIKLNKTLITSGTKTKSEFLRGVTKSAEVSANALSALSSADVSVENTMKFINQTGDFSVFLVEQLEDGKDLSAEQRASLTKIRDMMVRLANDLNRVKDKIAEGNLFIDSNTALTDIFAGLNDTSVEYPQLIYDGPFSDALNDKETKGLSGDDIDEAKGREILETVFKDYGIKNISFRGEWSADIPSLNYDATVNGTYTSLQLSKKGGTILSVNTYREVTDPKLTTDECAVVGRQFLEKLGYKDMTAVWTCNDNSTVFINYAPVVNGVILYPDLIKVKIASDNGNILGLEARNYAFNHTDRALQTPSLTAAQAKQKLSMPDGATGGKLCLIPYKTNAERLCYEFVVDSSGVYYIYIDAISGEEINILFVVSTTGGDKLI